MAYSNAFRAVLPLSCVALALSGCAAPVAERAGSGAATKRTETDFVTLVNRPDDTFRWERGTLMEAGGVAVRELRMTSQTWQGIPWTHRIQLFRAENADHPEFCILVNTGGSGGPQDTAMGQALARASNCTVAILYDVPNQPLFNGKNEDALIAHTWGRYIETGDPTWILNIPMTRSVLRGMDAVQAATKGADGPAVKGFLITGASKRGWTAWLAGTSGDRRIRAIAPMVFDMLNMPAQVPHQISSFGQPSEMIHDYSDAGMLDRLGSVEGKSLVRIVDPYQYRDRLTMPKLIVLGSNDRYWATDALNLYWDDLRGSKHVFYVPNAGHGLGDMERLGATLSGFARSVASGRPLPNLKWHTRVEAGRPVLSVSTGVAPVSVRLFRAEAPTRDFRSARWNPEPMTGRGVEYAQALRAPVSGFAAAFAEVEYRIEGRPVTLSTQITIEESGK